MFQAIAKRVFGTVNERLLRPLEQKIAAINHLEEELESLSDEGLRAKTAQFRIALAEGATEEDILVDAFAVVREASKRTLGMRPFDVQLLGGNGIASRSDCGDAYRRG